MGHWEHRWSKEGPWSVTNGPLGKCKSVYEVRAIHFDILILIGPQEWLVGGSDLMIRYVGGEMPEHVLVPMESPSFSLEEIELAQKMIGQK